MRTRADVAWCIGLTLLSALLRARALSPPSLWRDDAWQALVVRVDSWGDVARMGQSAPGFSVLLKLWLSLTGFSSLAAQTLPFAAGVVAAPFAYVVARRIGLDTWGAAAAGVTLALSRRHAIFSTRVKPFTLDADVTLPLILLGFRVLAQPGRASRWAMLVGAGMLATVMSASTLPVVLGTALVAVVATVRRGSGKALAGAAFCILMLLVGVWWAVWLRTEASNPWLREFWADSFMPLDRGVAAAAGFPLWHTWNALAGVSAAMPGDVTGVLVVLGAVVLARRDRRLIALILSGPALALVAATLQLAPYGGGRTDIYLYPCFALALGALIDGLSRRLSGRARSIALFLAFAILPVGIKLRSYPEADIRGVVDIVQSEARAGDAIIVYPQDGYAYALYSRFPVRMIRSDFSMTGFTTAVDHPGVATLILDPHPDRFPSRRYDLALKRNVEATRSLVDGTHAPGHVWVVSRGNVTPELAEIFEQAGLTPGRTWNRPGATLRVWTR
jgi:hypothetical protein